MKKQIFTLIVALSTSTVCIAQEKETSNIFKSKNTTGNVVDMKEGEMKMINGKFYWVPVYYAAMGAAAAYTVTRCAYYDYKNGQHYGGWNCRR